MYFYFALFAGVLSTRTDSYTAVTNQAQLILAKKVSAWNDNDFLVIHKETMAASYVAMSICSSISKRRDV